jgi:hypothetical protein
MIGRRTSLRELIHAQHEEFMQYQQQRDVESRRRDAEFRERVAESRRREARLDRLVEETREYNREILLRNEKVYKGVLIRLEELGKETRASTAQIKSSTEETRAQMQVLLKLIDRFDNRDDAAAA